MMGARLPITTDIRCATAHEAWLARVPGALSRPKSNGSDTRRVVRLEERSDRAITGSVRSTVCDDSHAAIIGVCGPVGEAQNRCLAL